MPASELGPAQGPIPGLPETAPRLPVWWIGPVPWAPPSTPVDLLPLPAPPPATFLPVTGTRDREMITRPEPIPVDGAGLQPPLPGDPAGFNIFDVRRTVQTIGTAGAVTGNPVVATVARGLDFVLSLFTPRPAAPVAPVTPTTAAPTGAAIGGAPPGELLLLAPEPTTQDTIQREYTPPREYAGYETRELTGKVSDGTFSGTVETVSGTREVEVELPFPDVGF